MNRHTIKRVSNLVKPFLTNNEGRNLNIAQMTHEFKGPICDDQGFSQHKGECWNDTLQEIFFFSDGLKDITQPLFYYLDTSTENLFTLIKTRLFPDTNELNDKELDTVNKLVKYIRLMKVRFVTHYNFLIDLQNKNKKTISRIYKSKRRYSTICGVASAKYIINLHHGNLNTYRPGLTSSLKNQLFNNLIRIFDIPFIVSELRESDKLANINGIFISSNLLMLIDANTYKYKGAHAFGFLKCDSIWKYYDDNERSGLIDLDESLVSVYISESDVAVGVDDDSNVHILKYKILESNSEANPIVSITHYYSDNKWNDWTLEWDNERKFDSIYTKRLLSIIRPRLRWGNMKKGIRRGGKTRKLLCRKN